MKPLILPFLLFVSLFCLNPPARAQEPEEWEFIFAPYGWFAGTDGDLTVGDQRVDVDVGFSDVWDTLDFGALGHFEARKGTWGGFLDVIYLKTSTDEDVTVGPAALGVELVTKQWITEVGGFYRIWRDRSRAASLDVLAGGRYWNLENELGLRLSGPAGETSAKRTEDSDWIDPLVGVRYKMNLTDRLLFNARADVGGFGVGSAADLTWNLVGLLGYELTPSISLWGGYKSLWLDRDEEINADLNIRGPVAGFSFAF